jgi:hypothetical protein
MHENYSISILTSELGLFPRLNPAIDKIQGMYKKTENRFYPSVGSNKEADFLMNQLENVKIELNLILEATR